MKSQDCANCEQVTNSACGNCKSVYFCSKECQKTLWPTHKFLCDKDPSSFFFPPLAKWELDDLWAFRDHPNDHTCNNCLCRPEVKVHGYTLIEHVNSLGLFDGDLEAFLNAITPGEFLLEEPRLSACIVLARSSLYTRRSQLDEFRRPPESRHVELIWNTLADRMSRFISCRDASQHFATPESNPFRRLAPIWRQHLVSSIHLVNGIEKGINKQELMVLAMRRLLKALKPVLESAKHDEVTLERLADLTHEANVCYNIDASEVLRLLRGSN